MRRPAISCILLAFTFLASAPAHGAKAKGERTAPSTQRSVKAAQPNCPGGSFNACIALDGRGPGYAATRCRRVCSQ